MQFKFIFSVIILHIIICFSFVQADMVVRHNSPAESWREADPMGNGMLGGMIWGGVTKEIINLNEDTFWSGEPEEHSDGKNCKDNLSKVRELIFAGKEYDAYILANETMSGKNNQCYQPLGNLLISIPDSENKKITNYKRSLSISQALHNTSFILDEVLYSREVFISHPDKIIAIRITASKANSLNLDITMDSLVEHKLTEHKNLNELLLTGRAPVHATPHYAGTTIVYDQEKGMRFASFLRAFPQGGSSTVKDNIIQLRNCDSAVLLLSASTSFNGFDKSPAKNGKDEIATAKKIIEDAGKRSYSSLKESHIADYTKIFDRLTIELGDGNFQDMAISERIHQDYQGHNDPDIAELFYQFGRYLLISSSRRGTQPANLQGIWSYKLHPSWSANWTVNCNAQFNYSGIGTANLDELTEPFLRMIEEASIDGAKVAKSWYGAKGWTIHHNIDLWRAAKPTGNNMLWAMFPAGGTWLVTELFDHWRFSQDQSMLKRLWPLLKGNANFWLSHMVKDPETGKLVSCPDVYFENTAPERKSPLCAAPISTTLMIHQLFADVKEAASALNISDDPILAQINKTIPLLPQMKIGDNGEIWQWDRGNWKESDSTQLLVMWGAIYSDQIHPRLSPETAQALKTMLNNRALGLNGQGSWRAAFPAQTYARLGDGNSSLKVFDAMMKKWINPNLTVRFIQSDWQIDGNLGLMTAMGECLIQSHAGEIELLPGIPDAWAKKGSVKGIRARGNITVDFSWEQGKVTQWKIFGNSNKTVKLRVNGKLITATPQVSGL
ncbi:MAG: glycoside hydrolase family 95 protein [Phycisphaerae bacterium]|nr:glycoside hydrolase family 95 protein [Phycisphaerae bacterium]